MASRSARAALAVLGGALFVLGGLGVIYYVFLYPQMVPHYGGGERIYPEGGAAGLTLESPRGMMAWIEADGEVQVYLDGRPAGSGRRVTVEVPAGFHELEVRGELHGGVRGAQAGPPHPEGAAACLGVGAGAHPVRRRRGWWGSSREAGREAAGA